MNSNHAIVAVLALALCRPLSALPGLCREPGCGVPDCQKTMMILDDDPAPGTGAAFQTFDRPNISATGRLAFTADTNAALDADDVIYLDLTLIAMESQPAPGTAGTFSVFVPFETAHQVSAGGEVAFIAMLANLPATEDKALYRYTSLATSLIAQEGMAAPGIPGRVLTDVAFAGIADDGTVGFVADLDGSTSDDSVIYFGAAPLYRQSNPVPGMPGVIWDGDFDEIQWNGRGDLLFEGNTSLPGAMDWVLMRRLSAGPVEEIVVQEGDEVVTEAGTDQISLILQSSLAENGLWAMRGSLALAPPEQDAFVLTEGGFFRQEGEPVDELPGVVLGNFNGISLNSAGDLLYLADLEGPTPPGVQEGLFLNCCLVLTDGMPVPGLPEGTTFSDMGFEDLAINDSGQIVFGASYSGSRSGDGLFVIECGARACAGDLDGDGVVAIADLVALILAWGTPDPEADLNGDGVVDVGDLVALMLAWGVCP